MSQKLSLYKALEHMIVELNVWYIDTTLEPTLLPQNLNIGGLREIIQCIYPEQLVYLN